VFVCRYCLFLLAQRRSRAGNGERLRESDPECMAQTGGWESSHAGSLLAIDPVLSPLRHMRTDPGAGCSPLRPRSTLRVTWLPTLWCSF
jgi:hypothetical protein